MLRYKGQIKEWVAASEIANSEMEWFDPKWRATYASLGGRQIVDDVCRWALEMDPGLRLTLVENETTDANNDVYRRETRQADDLLLDLKRRGTPIHQVACENNFWIYAPPAPGEVRERYKKLRALGFAVGPSEMVISMSELSPIWSKRPRTVDQIADKLEAQARIGAEALEAALDEGGVFGLWSGTDADTWHNYEGSPDSQPEPLDRNYQAKPLYIRLRKSLKARIP